MYGACVYIESHGQALWSGEELSEIDDLGPIMLKVIDFLLKDFLLISSSFEMLALKLKLE